MRIDFNNIYVPDEKLNHVVEESLQKVKKIRRKDRFRRIAGGTVAAAAALAVLTGICASNPVIAEQFTKLGEIFGLVENEQYYPGDYSSVSVPVPGENVSQSEGITITLSEFVCSSESLNISILIDSEDPFPELFRQSVADADKNGSSYIMLVTEQNTDFADIPMNPDGNMYLEARGAFQDEYTFAGVIRIDFNLYPYALYEIPDSFIWDLKITNIYSPDWTGKSDSPLAIPGKWTFSSQITRQEIGTKTVDVNQYAPNGDGIVSVTITPYEVDVEMGYDESKVQPGYERFDSIQSVMLDGSGKQIEDNIGLFSPDGYDLSMITVYYVETPDEASWLEIQDKLLDKNFAPQLQEYLEDIAIQKIEIPW